MNRTDPKNPDDPNPAAERLDKRDRGGTDPGTSAVEFPKNPVEPEDPEEHEGATEQQIGDSTGPGAGYDDEPERTEDKGGVS